MALACAPACALDSKSLGEDAGESSDTDETEDSGGTGDTDEGPPPAAVEISAQLVEGVTPSEIAIAPDGSVYVVGRSGYSYDADIEDGDYASAWIGKLDDEGTIEWSIEPGEASLGIVSAAAADDGLVVATSSRRFDVAPALARYDAQGELLWSIETPLDSGIARVGISLDDTIVVVGTGSGGADSSDARTAAYDGATGDLLWESAVGTGDVRSSGTKALAFTPDGDVIVGGGQGVEYLTGRTRAWIAALDPSGTTRWVQTYTEGLETDSVQDLHVTSDGTIHAVVIDTEATSIRRFDAAGGETWVWDPSLTSEARSIAVADDGSFVTTDGREVESSAPPVALRVASRDANGSVRWFDEREDCTLGQDVAILDGGEVMVVGACPPGQGDVEIAMGLFVYAP